MNNNNKQERRKGRAASVYSSAVVIALTVIIRVMSDGRAIYIHRPSIITVFLKYTKGR